MKGFRVVLLAILSMAKAETKTSSIGEVQFPKLANYQPLVDVRDQAQIDRDLDLLSKLLSEANLEEAKRVYEQGSFSRSYAELELGFGGLPGDIHGHSTVTGQTEDGKVIKGVIMDHGKVGAKTVRIAYNNLDNPSPCYVGGNPDPVFDGCFALAGQLTFDNFNKIVPYSYNMKNNNKNDRILAWFSTQTETKMRPCTKCELFTDFYRYYMFYGKYDYAHRWIMAALTGARIVFDSSAVDFTAFSLAARAEAAKAAIVTLSIFPYVIREMEESVHNCRAISTKKEGEDPKFMSIHSIDTAVAFYTGSLEDGSGSGQLFYSFANDQCQHFKTCGELADSTHGTANVNLRIMESFTQMQGNLTVSGCWDAHGVKNMVVRQMKVPLIQSVIRTAYKRANKLDISDVDIAIGAAHTAAIVPLLSACSFRDAEIVDNNMETTAKQTNFDMIKETFERQYACLGITCRDVGGIWNKDTKSYYEGAEPCTTTVDESEFAVNEDSGKGRKIGWGVSVTIMVIAIVFVYMRRQKLLGGKKRKQDRMGDDLSDSSDDSDFDIRFT